MDKILDSLEALPEHFHQFYEKQADGKFALQDIAPLKNSLTHAKRERDEARAKAKQVSEWEGIGKTPAEIAEMLAAQTKVQEELDKKAGNFDNILAAHRKKLEDERDAVAKERDTWKNSYVQSTVNTGLMAALAAGAATPEGLAILPEILSKRTKVDVVDNKVNVSILGIDGNPMIGNGAGGVATYEDLIADAKKSFPSLFTGTKQSGSGASGGSDKGSGASNLKRSTMSIPQKAKYIEEHGQAEFLKLPYS